MASPNTRDGPSPVPCRSATGRSRASDPITDAVQPRLSSRGAAGEPGTQERRDPGAAGPRSGGTQERRDPGAAGPGRVPGTGSHRRPPAPTLRAVASGSSASPSPGMTKAVARRTPAGPYRTTSTMKSDALAAGRGRAGMRRAGTGGRRGLEGLHRLDDDPHDPFSLHRALGVDGHVGDRRVETARVGADEGRRLGVRVTTWMREPLDAPSLSASRAMLWRTSKISGGAVPGEAALRGSLGP